MNAIKNQMKDLLGKEMDRKDFLKYAGGIILTIVGVTGLLRVLLGSSQESSHNDAQRRSGGYGSSGYGM